MAGGRISDLLLERGHARAQGIAARGQGWGDLVSGGALTFGNVMQQHRDNRAAQAQAQAERAKQAAAARVFSGNTPPSVADLMGAGFSAEEAMKLLGDYAKTRPEPEPFTLSEGQSRYGADGQLIASQPKAEKPAEGFTLSEGQIRYGADGQQIAAAPKVEKAKDAAKLGSEEDFIQRAASEMGKTVDQLTAKQVESIRRRYAQTTRFTEPGSDKGEWVRTSTGDIVKRVPQAGDTPYDAVAARQQASTEGGMSPYSAERSTRILARIDEVSSNVGLMTAGVGGLMARIPATDARKLKGDLDELKANIAFNELTQMREASKTGGALGSIAVRELELLERTLGTLDQLLSPADLKANLARIKESVQRWNAAKAQGQLDRGAAVPNPGPDTGAGWTDVGGGFRVRVKQ